MVAYFWFIYLLDAKSNEFTESTQEHGLVSIITMVKKCMYFPIAWLLICESQKVTFFKWGVFFPVNVIMHYLAQYKRNFVVIS